MQKKADPKCTESCPVAPHMPHRFPCVRPWYSRAFRSISVDMHKFLRETASVKLREHVSRDM